MKQRPNLSQLETRLIWLMVLRVVLVTTLLGSAVTIEVIAQPEFQVRRIYYLIALTYLLTLIYALVWPFTVSYRRQMAYSQVFADLLIITGVVYITGGIEANFSLLYFISIISASINLYRVGGLAAAGIASACYGSVVIAIYAEVLPAYPLPGSDPSPVEAIYYSIFFNSFGFFTVALLTSYLSEGLRKTGQEL